MFAIAVNNHCRDRDLALKGTTNSLPYESASSKETNHLTADINHMRARIKLFTPRFPRIFRSIIKFRCRSTATAS